MARNVMKHTKHKWVGNILSIHEVGTKSQLLPKISFEGSPKFGHPDSLVTLFSLVTLVSLVTPVSLVTLLVVGAHFSGHFFTVLHFS